MADYYIRLPSSTSTPLQAPSFTELQRNALIPTEGMIIYDTTTDKLQVYADGNWVNLN